MNTAKQKLLLGYLLSSPDVFALCSPIIKTSFFDPEFRSTVRFIMSYYEKYNAIPSIEQVKAETDVDLITKELTSHEVKYSCEEVEKFCKHKGMVEAVLKAADMVDKAESSTNVDNNDLDQYTKIESLVKDALMISLDNNIAVSFFDNPEEQLSKMVEEDTPYPLGWTEFDNTLDGGPRRKELILLSANSGIGKSQVIGNVVAALAKNHKLRGLYISLELPIKTLYKRFTAMIADINPRDIVGNETEACIKIKNARGQYGDVKFVRLPAGTTSNQIRAFLKKFELKYGYIPDVLGLDYIDQMGSNAKISVENISQKDKACSEEVREILEDYNMIGITASQQTRGALTSTERHQGHIAGGITKVNTTDIYVSIYMTDIMRAQGQIAFHFLKTRNSDGVGKTVFMHWNRNSLRVENPKGSPKDKLSIEKKIREDLADDMIEATKGSDVKPVKTISKTKSAFHV